MQPGKIRKTVFLLAVISLGLSFSTAQGLEAKDGEVWLNPGVDIAELSYSCGQLETLEFESVTGSNQRVFDSLDSKGNLSTRFFRQEGFETGLYNVTQNCSEENKTDSATLELRNLSISTGKPARAFFGGKSIWGEVTRPLELDFSVQNGEFSVSKLDVKANSNYVSVERYSEDESALVLDFGSDFNPDTQEVNLEVSYAGSSVKTVVTAPVNVYSWKPELKGDNPGRKVQYSNLDGLTYNFDVRKGRGVSGTLYEEDFVVSIEKVDSGETVYSEQHWIETSESENAEYSISLGNIPDLDTGRYNFRFSILKNGDKVPIDSLRVVKSLQFEGQVRDSRENGVKTEMTLVQNERTVPVTAGSDGLYSKQIRGDSFKRIDLDFFDRGRQSPDTSLTLRDVELGTGDSSRSSEAIKYQYWENPPVSVPGLDPVNMMAVKFGHQIKGGADTEIVFDPSNINPENLEVFRCQSWNFQGRKCMSTWSKVQDSRKSISYTNWNVKVQDLKLHHISEDVGGKEKDILLNAYIVGTSSRLGLEGQEAPLSVNKQRIEAKGDLEISGTVIGSDGNYVEDASVDIELRKDGNVTKSFSTESDERGEFTIKGKAPSESGKYRIQVSIQKKPYKPFTTESSSELEVYYRKSMEMKSPEKDSILLGAQEDISFQLENTGQVEINSLSVELEGLEKSLYTKKSVPESIQPGETKKISYSVNIPRSYCPYPCGQPPSFTLKAEGSALDQNVRAMSTVFTSVDDGAFNESESNNSLSSSDDTGFVSKVSNSLEDPTGSFLKRQSSVNIALGLIMVFTMVLAVAVKKRKNDGGDRNRFGGQGFQSYSSGSSFSPGSSDSGFSGRDTDNRFDSEDSPQASDDGSGWRKYSEKDSGNVYSGEDDSEKQVSSEDGKFVCEETGESFDTKAALKMHKKINGIED